MRKAYWFLICVPALAAIGPACSGANSGNTVGTGGSNSGGNAGSGGNTGGTGNIVVDPDGGGGTGNTGPGDKLTTTPPCNPDSADADSDGDGFSTNTGDCNDCTKQMNPGAYDYPGNTVDEDCNGTPDDEPVGCDTQTFDVGYGDPEVAARAIGLCRKATATSWGLVSAKYVKADGTPGMNDLSHGLLPNFGPNVSPREGLNMLALSSGTARRPTDPGFKSPWGYDFASPVPEAGLGTSCSTPPGFPIDSPSCAVQTAQDKTANDPAALELVIKTPSNANELGFDFDFYTYEFPDYVCSIYNDFFVALIDPPPADAQQGNVSFDSQGNPVSVNNGYLEVCVPQNAGGKSFPCARGTAELTGTGFDELEETGPHAATSWLNTRAPVPPGTNITVRFAIWDMGDHVLDSTVLIDNMTWDVGEGGIPTTVPVPQ